MPTFTPQPKARTQSIGTNPQVSYGYGYDQASQLLDATLKDATGMVTKQYTYRYDLAGNRTLEQINNSVSSATYNNVNQITSRTGAGPMVIEGTVNEQASVTVGGLAAPLDGQNRFSTQFYVQPGQQSITITARDAQGRQTTGQAVLTAVAGAANAVPPAYDLNGNILSDGTRAYAWDAENRLVTITQGGNVRQFAYNGLGQRVSETDNGTMVKQWVSDGTTLCAELDGSSNVTKRFFAQGEQIGANAYYYTRDHLGSVREMTDATNNLVARYDYDPWGRRTANQVTLNPVESDFGFTGHYFDAPTGLHVAFYRWYDADSARWLNRDPIGEEGGINLYGYVFNNPVNFTDSDGQKLRKRPPERQ